MKFSSLALLLLLSACGDYKDEGSDRVGDTRPLTQTLLSDYEVQRLSQVCQALRLNEIRLPGMVNQPLTFSTERKDCEGNEIPSGDVSVLIQKEGASYTFKEASTGVDFLFPEVETTTGALFTTLCGSTNPVSPMIQGTEATFFRTSGIRSSDCDAGGDDICLGIERATIQENGTAAVVHTKEWLRIKVRPQDEKYAGFVTLRKKVSRGFCARDEVLIQKAQLK